MKIKICILIVSILVSLQGWPQPKKSPSFFNLAIQAEEEDMPGTAYMSVDYTSLGMISMRNYQGSDEQLTTLAKMITELSKQNESAYYKLSNPKDTTLAGSYSFYSTFLPHADNPKVVCKVKLGDYSIFYLKLEEGFPLMTFCLKKVNGRWLNTPFIMEHPAVIAMTDAINKSYLYPSKFKATSKLPVPKNTKIRFDSVFGDPNFGLNFYMNIYKVSYNTKNKNDSTNSYNNALKPCLDFYANALGLLDQGKLDSYYLTLSPGSKDRIRKTLNESDNNGLEYFKAFKSSFSKVVYVIDLGEVKLLLAQNPFFGGKKFYQKIYIRMQPKPNWINEQSEFYLDDLLRLPAFKSLLFGEGS